MYYFKIIFKLITTDDILWLLAAVVLFVAATVVFFQPLPAVGAYLPCCLWNRSLFFIKQKKKKEELET
jgi:hypothetical protein